MSILKNALNRPAIALLFFISACKNKPAEVLGPLSANPAYKSINDSIAQFPDRDSLYLRRALRLSRDNAHEWAYGDFRKAFTLNPTLDNALPYATNLEILGKRNEKMALLNEMNKKYPDNPRVSRLLAEGFAASGDPRQALRIYDALIERDSLNPEPYYEKALLLEQNNDKPGAIACLQKAFALQQVDTYGLELAMLYAEQKDARALEICNSILRSDSARIQTDPLFIKGIYFANIRQFQKAITQFDSCIARDWKTTDAYLEKGRAYFQMKKFKEAMQTFTMAVTVTQTDPDAYYWLGRSLEAQNRNFEAIQNYQRALSLERNFPEARERIEKLRGFAHPSE